MDFRFVAQIIDKTELAQEPFEKILPFKNFFGEPEIAENVQDFLQGSELTKRFVYGIECEITQQPDLRLYCKTEKSLHPSICKYKH